MKIETKFLVDHWQDVDKVIGKIGIRFDTEVYEDIAYLEFQRGHWNTEKADFEKSRKDDDFVFVALDEEKIDELIKTLELIKEQIS